MTTKPERPDLNYLKGLARIDDGYYGVFPKLSILWLLEMLEEVYKIWTAASSNDDFWNEMYKWQDKYEDKDDD